MRVNELFPWDGLGFLRKQKNFEMGYCGFPELAVRSKHTGAHAHTHKHTQRIGSKVSAAILHPTLQNHRGGWDRGGRESTRSFKLSIICHYWHKNGGLADFCWLGGGGGIIKTILSPCLHIMLSETLLFTTTPLSTFHAIRFEQKAVRNDTFISSSKAMIDDDQNNVYSKFGQSETSLGSSCKHP